jgi:hypothetical protein
LERSATVIADNVGQTSEAVVRTAVAFEKAADKMQDRLEAMAKTVGDVRIFANSLLGTLSHGFERIVQELQLVNQNLEGIKDQLAAQNTLAAAGGSGPDGFAQVAYGYVRSHLRRYPDKGHMFFLFHPSSTWHWRFEELVEANPLPPSVGAISHNLDQLCLCMQAVREQLGHEKQQTVFHLLIPTWYPVTLDMPLHFPDEVLPLHIVGFREGGKALVAFNLPAKQETLVLEDVDNNIDPHGQRLRAEIAGCATWLIGGGWVINGACLAAGVGLGVVTGLGPLIAVPVWFGSQVSVGAPIAAKSAAMVRDALTEEKPRILGTDRRLDYE